MTFEEITQLVVTAEPPPDMMNLTEQLCYQSLSRLFERYIVGSIDQTQAAGEKQRIKSAFETRKGFDEIHRQMVRTHQDNILKSSELRVAINKGHELSASQLFVLAVECISRMTGDTAFLKNTEKVVLQPTQSGGDKSA